MVTLREFLKMADRTHYRIYQPNRDCLIFESYYKVHNPYKFDSDCFDTNRDYWDNNDYCGMVLEQGWQRPDYDEETSKFLDHFGHYEVFGVDPSGCRPHKMYKGEDGELKFEYPTGLYGQNDDGYIDCLDIYIIPYDPDHSYLGGCDGCFHAMFIPEKDKKNRICDPKDVECQRCPHLKKD